MRTFRYRDDKSDKFWNIELEGTKFTVTYGRAGAQGQTQIKEFADAAKAKTAHDALVKAKLSKGYVETTPVAAPPSNAQVLEKALVEDPDDLAAHAAYADWLSEQGDPRGEFIQVQLALEDPGRSPAQRKQLQKREQALLQKHGREWLGPLTPVLLDRAADGRSGQGNQFQFARGWLDSLEIAELTVATARILAQAPQTRLLRRLVITEPAYEEDGEFEPGADVPETTENPTLYPLLRSPYLGNLRVFQLGEQYEDTQYGGTSCHTNGEVAVDLVAKMPRLEELYLMAHEVNTNQLFSMATLTHLRVLEVDHVHRYPLERLARNPALARLTTLRCHPHGLDDEEAYIRLPGLRAILRSPNLTSLTHLRLCLSDVGDDGCTEVVRSGALRRLRVLDLSHGCVTDAGARILADSPDLKHLELLNLNYNALTQDGIQVLQATGIRALAVEQFGQREIDEHMFLYGGDPE